MAKPLCAIVPALAVFLAVGAADAFELEEVAQGLFVHQGQQVLPNPENQGDMANLVAVIGEDKIAVIDTGGSIALGLAFRDAIQAISDLPISYVINTHAHPDHILGNAAFLDENVKFIGHSRLPRALADRGESYLSNMARLTGDASIGNAIHAPTILVDDQTMIDLGGRPLAIKAWPTGHTNADISVFDPQTGSLILGDLLFMDHLPALDGSLLGWIDVIAQLTDNTDQSMNIEQSDINRVIPGHGPISASWPQAIQAQKSYLTALRDDLRKAIEKGADIDDVTQTIAVADGPWLLVDEYHPRNVITGYTELEWE